MRVGTLCYATHQGLGYLARDFYRNGVVTDVVVRQHPRPESRPAQPWYPGARTVTGFHNERPFFRDFLASVDAMLFFETPFFWELLPLCRDMGVKTALVTMYEWSLVDPPAAPDLYLCPSELDLEYFPGGKFLRVPVDAGKWRHRTRAVKFLHQAGNGSVLDRPGTADLMAALNLVEQPIDVTVRAQNPACVRAARAAVRPESNARVSYQSGDLPHETLYDGFDVLVAPERFNGLSLPLQEAYSAGMYVLTTDRFPTNQWVGGDGLVAPAGSARRQVGGRYKTFDLSILSPREIARRLDETAGKDVSAYSLKARDWARANSWAELGPKWAAALKELL